MAEVAPKRKKPAGIVVNTTEVTATIEALDYPKRPVTLREPTGVQKTFAVDPRVEKFSSVKVGDKVVIRVTDALMIRVEKL